MPHGFASRYCISASHYCGIWLKESAHVLVGVVPAAVRANLGHREIKLFLPRDIVRHVESAPIIVSGMLALTSILLTIVGFLIAMLIKDVKGAIVILTKEVHGVSENYVESRVRLDNVERQAMRIVQMGEDVATMKYAMMSYLDKTKRDS